MAGLTSVSDDWQSITTNDIITGLKYNTDFISGGVELVYFIGDKSIKASYQNDSIQNCTKVLASLMRSNDALTIKRFDSTGENKYTVGKASDIQYVARYIDTFIESKTSTSVFNIPLAPSEKIGKYDDRFTSNALGGKLICRITSDEIEYLRQFSISGQEITLLDIVTGSISPISTLVVNDRFELLNAYDVLEEGLEETTGYPIQGFVKKHVKPNDDTSYIEFGKYDTPMKLLGESVIISFNELADYNQTFIYDESIDRYGVFTKNEELSFSVTQAQINYIESTLKKFIEPKITIQLETFRPTKPLKGWYVNVDVDNMATGIFKITDVSETYISPNGQQIDKPFRLWKVTLTNYENNLASVLAGLKRRADLGKSKLATNQVLRTAIDINLQTKFIDDPSEYGLDTPVALDADPVNDDNFTANWEAVPNANNYILVASLSPTFNGVIDGFGGIYTGNVLSYLVDGQEITDNDTFYFKVKAVNTDLNLESDFSNTITVNKVTTDLVMPSGKSAALLWNSDSMIGSGTNINDLVNNNDGTLSNSTSWVTDATFGSGVNLANVSPSIAHNNNYKIAGTTSKCLIAYVLNFSEINSSMQLLYNTQNPPNSEVNIYTEYSGGQLRFYFNFHDFNQFTQPSILGIRTSYVTIPTNTNIGLAFLVDLQNETASIILNQTELTVALVPTAESFYFYDTFAGFKGNGGTVITNQTVNIGVNANLGTVNTKAKLFRMLIAKDSNTPTVAEIKTMFSNIGLT